MTRQIYLFILAFCSNSIVIGQSQTTLPSTKEMRINYSNGYEVFNVYLENPNIAYYDSLDYYWLSDSSNEIISTKGWVRGKLLNGSYKSYDKNRNLISDKNFKNGLVNGDDIERDSTGAILGTYKYKDGKAYYSKFFVDSNWLEFKGEMYSINSVLVIHSKDIKSIIEVDTFLNREYAQSITKYYPGTNIISEYYKIFAQRIFFGKYIKYYENGKINEIGQYSDSSKFYSIKVGDWKYYDLNGTCIVKKYRRQIAYYENGSVESEGGEVFDEQNSIWIKNGIWFYYNSNGSVNRMCKYENGNFYLIKDLQLPNRE